MNDLLTEAKLIIANNKTENAARDLIKNEQRAAIAEDYANRKQFFVCGIFHARHGQKNRIRATVRGIYVPENN